MKSPILFLNSPKPTSNRPSTKHETTTSSLLRTIVARLDALETTSEDIARNQSNIAETLNLTKDNDFIHALGLEIATHLINALQEENLSSLILKPAVEKVLLTRPPSPALHPHKRTNLQVQLQQSLSSTPVPRAQSTLVDSLIYSDGGSEFGNTNSFLITTTPLPTSATPFSFQRRLPDNPRLQSSSGDKNEHDPSSFCIETAETASSETVALDERHLTD